MPWPWPCPLPWLHFLIITASAAVPHLTVYVHGRRAPGVSSPTWTWCSWPLGPPGDTLVHLNLPSRDPARWWLRLRLWLWSWLWLW